MAFLAPRAALIFMAISHSPEIGLPNLRKNFSASRYTVLSRYWREIDLGIKLAFSFFSMGPATFLISKKLQIFEQKSEGLFLRSSKRHIFTASMPNMLIYRSICLLYLPESK